MQYYKIKWDIYLPRAFKLIVPRSFVGAGGGGWDVMLQSTRGQCWAARCSCGKHLARWSLDYLHRCTRAHAHVFAEQIVCALEQKVQHSSRPGQITTSRDTALMGYCSYDCFLPLLRLIKCQALWTTLSFAAGLQLSEISCASSFNFPRLKMSHLCGEIHQTYSLENLFSTNTNNQHGTFWAFFKELCCFSSHTFFFVEPQLFNIFLAASMKNTVIH